MHRYEERGQSNAVAFALGFGLVLFLLVVIQAIAVPAWNQAVEQEHRERVAAQFTDLRRSIHEVATRGVTDTVTVELGPRYPRRPFLLNPADPEGVLRTTRPGSITVANATATGDVGDYWNGTTRQFSTRLLTYRPRYQLSEDSPTTGYEHSVVYERFSDAAQPASDALLVHGRDLTLVTLAGTLSKRGIGTTPLDVRPLSAPATTTSVRGAGEPVTITLPTRLPESVWHSLLADQQVSNGGHVTAIEFTSGQPYDRVTLHLEANVTYDLHLGRAGVGITEWTPDPTYVVATTPNTPAAPVGGSTTLSVQVRDSYNNPISGVVVEGTVSAGSGTVSPASIRTGAAGRATFTYECTTAGTATVVTSFGGGTDAAERVSQTVNCV